MVFIETAVITLIVIQGSQLLFHFFDKLSSSTCTSKNHKLDIKMKETREHHHYHEND